VTPRRDLLDVPYFEPEPPFDRLSFGKAAALVACWCAVFGLPLLYWVVFG